MWFGWDGQVVRVSSLVDRRKVRNLRSNRQAALLVVDPDDDYRYMELRGTVERMEEDVDHAFIDEMARRYLRVPTYPWRRPGDRRGWSRRELFVGLDGHRRSLPPPGRTSLRIALASRPPKDLKRAGRRAPGVIWAGEAGDCFSSIWSWSGWS